MMISVIKHRKSNISSEFKKEFSMQEIKKYIFIWHYILFCERFLNETFVKGNFQKKNKIYHMETFFFISRQSKHSKYFLKNLLFIINYNRLLLKKDFW